MSIQPPKWIDRFLQWYCNPDLLEEIQGDAHELYYKRLKKSGKRSAHLNYLWDIIKFFRWSNIKRDVNYISESTNGLFFMNFKIAVRNIKKYKFYAALNILGLAIGLTSSLLIGLYIYDELTFDRFHKDYDTIYHVGLHLNIDGQESKLPQTPPPLSAEMVNSIPGVEQATRLKRWLNVVVKTEDKAFTETKAILVDSNFFEFFSFKLTEGNPKTALKEPHEVVITPATAIRYFGNTSPVGQIITVGNKNETFKVTGIVAPAPANSHIQFDLLLSAQSDRQLKEGEWGDNGIYTYYKKNAFTQPESVEHKLREIVIKYCAPEMEEGTGLTLKQFEKQGGVYAFFSYPLSSSHLYHPELPFPFSPSSEIKYVYMMVAIGLFILIIACINFMNLSTAHSARRAKEVGLRKTLGSLRSKLIIQFFSESIVYVFVALVVALIGVYLLLPAFNVLTGKALLFSILLSPNIWIALAVLFVLIVLLAGSYPAFYLTSFNTVDVLRGKVSSGMKSKGLRSFLVVVQFVISISLIICTMVVYNQLHYMEAMNIGFDKHNIVLLKNTNRLKNNQKTFFEALSNQTGITSMSYTDIIFPELNNSHLFRKSGTKRDLLMGDYSADYNHLEVLKMELLQGRYFSKEFKSDSLACVINEAALKTLNWADPINQKLMIYDDDEPVDLHVIGVVKDFNIESFKTKVNPLVIRLKKRANNLLIRYSNTPKEVIAMAEGIWKNQAKNEPFEYAFMDQRFDDLFREEQRLSQVFTMMSSMAIFIACLGLLGLASFTAEQRTKEIGIRKVMGASVASVNSLLSKEFMVLVGVSFAIASVLAWYTMSNWLNTFAYRIELSPFVFILGGLIATVVAWLTVSYHFIKAARSNPLDALKYE